MAAASYLAAALAGLAAGLASAMALAPAAAMASALLAAIMVAIAAEDLRRFVVPDLLLVLALAGGLAYAAVTVARDSGTMTDFLALCLPGAALGGGAFLLIRELYFRLEGTDGLGLGDVKLAAVGGVWLGWELIGVAVLVASAAALAAIGARIALGRPWPRRKRLPYAAFLAPAVWAVWFVERTGIAY